ncbi:response regulator [Sideroxydans sp.]
MTITLNKSNTLVIDDFQSMRSMIMGFLKSMGVTNISNVGTAREALELLSSKKFDLVICDYNLGQGKNGQQILEEARHKRYIGHSTVWMMVTAEKTMDMFMGAAEAKPDDYLLKPVTEAMLSSRLQKLFEKKRMLEPVEKAVKSRNYAHAIKLCEEQLATPSANTQELQRIKSDLLINSGDFVTAKTFLSGLLAARNIPWVKTSLGKVHYLSKDYIKARELFEEVLQENKMYLEAADWLAKSLDALGESALAQAVLEKAMMLSPNATLRQKSLADAALKNGALELAQSAYEKAIKLGEFSVHKSAGNFAGLAKVLTTQNDPEQALKILTLSRNEFKDEPAATLQTAVAESLAHHKLGNTEQALASLQEAEALIGETAQNTSVDTTIDMANMMFQLGQKDKACGLLESVVKNNHENRAILQRVETTFEDAGMAEEGLALIKSSSKEVIDINNQGVALANEGKFEEGIRLIRKALQAMPNNDLMITNLCGMMIGMMHRTGKDDRMLFEVSELLERVGRLNPTNKKYHPYVTLLGKMSATD